jgi:hypothetical protein
VQLPVLRGTRRDGVDAKPAMTCAIETPTTA